jgi:anti-sigma B factor antagonist
MGIMSLILNTRKVNGHIVVEASGKLERGEPFVDLRELAKRLTADEGSRHVILDMAGISYVDSSGLGLLLSIYATIRNQGGELKLLNVAPRVHEVLRMTKLLQVFDIFDDEKKALAKKSSSTPS